MIFFFRAIKCRRNTRICVWNARGVIHKDESWSCNRSCCDYTIGLTSLQGMQGNRKKCVCLRVFVCVCVLWQHYKASISAGRLNWQKRDVGRSEEGKKEKKGRIRGVIRAVGRREEVMDRGELMGKEGRRRDGWVMSGENKRQKRR